jgi:hypothetical protein
MNYPAYGFMPDSWQAADDLGKPDRFKNADGSPATHEDWIAWLEARADELASVLWPRFSAGWQGSSAAGMRALTLADLALMRSKLLPVLEEIVPGTKIKHSAFFLLEDKKPPNAEGLLHYAANAPGPLLANFDEWSLGGLRDLGRPPTLNLKRRMQRPRPHQAAFLESASSHFNYKAAASATTPSLVSGHALQAAMGLVNLVVEFEQSTGKPTDAALLSALQQYFIDAGDRRVFAGVHYPTDNVASWAVALQLCTHVFGAQQSLRARAVLRDAFTTKSRVYYAMTEEAKRTANSPFAKPIAWLDQLRDGGSPRDAEARAPVAQPTAWSEGPQTALPTDWERLGKQ